MITKLKEVKKPTISYQNYQALYDYLVYNGSVEEYSKALNKLKIYFVIGLTDEVNNSNKIVGS